MLAFSSVHIVDTGSVCFFDFTKHHLHCTVDHLVLLGEWEIIRVQEPAYERQLEAGQILWGEGELKEKEWNLSTRMTLVKDGTCKGQMTDNEWNIVQMNGKWSFLTEKHLLMVDLNSEKIENLVIFAGHDWENETETILFTGLDSRGRSVWGKRIK